MRVESGQREREKWAAPGFDIFGRVRPPAVPARVPVQEPEARPHPHVLHPAVAAFLAHFTVLPAVPARGGGGVAGEREGALGGLLELLGLGGLGWR